MIRLDLHIHSNASFDCRMRPATIAKVVKRTGLDGFALTDHDSVENNDEAAFHAKRLGLLFIPGIEKKTDIGDVIGLFVSRDILSFDYCSVIEEIHERGGVAVLPHPLKSHKNLPHHAWDRFDFIEALNARCPRSLNEEVTLLASRRPVVAGSDAHSIWDIGRVYNEIQNDSLPSEQQSLRELLISKPIHTVGLDRLDESSQKWSLRYSTLIQTYKKHGWWNMTRLIVRRVASLGT